jgi:hypothetical protein
MNKQYTIKFSVLLVALTLSYASASASMITVTSPNGGEIWSGMNTITWTSDMPSSGFVNIYTCDTNTCLSTTSVQVNVPNSGSFAWDTSALNETTKIYIEDTSSSSIFDTSDATFKIDNSIASCNATIASNNLTSPSYAKVGDIVIVNFDPCEAVSTTTVSIAGRTVLATNVGGTNWIATTSMQATDTQGDIPFSVSYTDLAGNSLTRSSTANGSSVTFDITPPTLTINLATTTFISGATGTITFTFSEPVIGFTNNALKADNGTLSPVISLDGGITWTAVFTASTTVATSTNSIVVDTAAITDKAGNITATLVISPNYVVTIASIVPVLPDTTTCKGRGWLMPPTVDKFKRKTNVDITTRENSQEQGKQEGRDKEKEEKDSLEDSPFCFQKDLHTGVKDKDVKELQKRLISAGLLKSEITGYFGTLTKEALRMWQINNNIEPTGEVLGVSTFSFQKDLYMGSQSNTEQEVKELQKRLISAGLLNYEPTGYFGKMTKEALIQWQTKNNLNPRGYLGPMSRQILNKDSEASS